MVVYPITVKQKVSVQNFVFTPQIQTIKGQYNYKHRWVSSYKTVKTNNYSKLKKARHKK